MYLGFFFSLFYIFHEVHAFGRDLGKLPSFSGWYLPCFLLLAMLLSKNLSFHLEMQCKMGLHILNYLLCTGPVVDKVINDH